jgi:hypothetical protein
MGRGACMGRGAYAAPAPIRAAGALLGRNPKTPTSRLTLYVACSGRVDQLNRPGFPPATPGVRVSNLSTAKPHPTLTHRLCWIPWELEPFWDGIRPNQDSVPTDG